MDICFQVVLFQTEKSFNRAHYYYIYIFVSFVMFIWIPILFIFNVFFFFFFFLHLFADNVGVWAFLTLHWMWFFSVYIICNIEGAASFSSVAVYSLRSLPCECVFVCMRVHAHVCMEVLCVCVCDCVCEWVCVRSSLPWHAYLTALSWSSRSTDS